jgi:hypothetical protein
VETITYYRVIKQEIDHLREQLQTEDTGHIYTALSVLMTRLKEIEHQLTETERFLLRLSE